MRALDWSSMVLRALLSARPVARRHRTDLALVRIEQEKETDSVTTNSISERRSS